MESRALDTRQSRSRSPPPWSRQRQDARYDERRNRDRPGHRNGRSRHGDEKPRRDNHQGKSTTAQDERDWIAKEDDFVLKQAKKKAQIRVREGRAKPIDWLAILAVVDEERDLEDEEMQMSIDVADPTILVDDLDLKDLRELLKDIDHYAVLEKHRDNLRYWRSVKLLCSDRIRQLESTGASARGVRSVSADVARLLGDKTKHQLDTLEGQVRSKLDSEDDIDVEYWEHLLDSIGIYKAKASLSSFYKTAMDSRLRRLKEEQALAARTAQERLARRLADSGLEMPLVNHDARLEPEATLDISAADKGIKVVSEEAFLASITADRQRIQRTGYVPKALRQGSSTGGSTEARVAAAEASQTTNAMYDREAARGVEDDEEVFAAEAEVAVPVKKRWEGSFIARKPKYFNRVQMGYEWNKYNQTHYDQENPPPKVVQGYKFNIFYPDLIDRTKAPTFNIEREHGRKRGETMAPAGEEDTCIIRFTSGPPYENLAFRIVDKEWDYSARRERGFKSSFDKGILQLHFQFKKVYYRK